MAWDNYPLYTDIMASPEFIAETSRTLRAELANFETPVDVCVASKYATVDEIRCLYNEGFRIFGENKVQDALIKIEALADLNDISWHFIGHLQRNKVRKIVPCVDVIQSVDSLELLEKINEVATEFNKTMTCFIQINIGKESNKSGFLPENFIENKSKFFSFSNINIQGIMIVAPQLDDKNALKKLFNEASLLFQTTFSETQNYHLSMGMSQDFGIAIDSGSTMVRIGRRLFQS